MRQFSSSISWLAAFLALLGVAANAAAGPAAETSLRWQRPGAGIDSDGATAVARERNGNRVAIGDSRGVLVGEFGRMFDGTGEWVGGSGQAFRRLLHRGPIRDLAFADDGTLLAATDDGLYRVDQDGRHTQIVLGPGAASRAVTRVVTEGGMAAVATEDGVYVSSDTGKWHRLAGAMPSGVAHAVALRASGEGFVCWSIVAGELWRVELESSGDAWAAAASRRTVLPAGVRDDSALDIAVDLGSIALAIVFPTALAVVEDSDSAHGATSESTLRWKVVRPQLPPGASAHRLVHGGGRYWLATDRGLLESAAVEGPWRRTTPPAGSAEVAGVIAGADEIVAAARDGIWIGRAVPDGPPSPLSSGPDEPYDVPEDPPIVQVHRAAIHHLGLELSRMEALRRGARRRGWWPIITVRSAGEWDHGRSTDYDEAFLAGETHYLTDRDFDRGDAFDVSLTLSWDLRDVAYEPESIDVSHETREVIELRDDVLDEITQLYFERRALLAALRFAGRSEAPETSRLRLRADELAAGIDAWTGGWFSARVPALAR